MKAKSKVLLSSIASIALCSSIAVGGTYALFTSESKVNIAVTSGKVEVVATADGLKTYSMGVEQATGTFENGGTATLVDNQLNLNLMSPGDKATFTIDVENNSTITVQYKLTWTVEGDLADGLEILANNEELADVSWTELAVGADIASLAVSVELPEDAGNEYQNKTASVSFLLEAVQGNAEMPDEWDGTEDTTWYNDTDAEFIITTAEELAGFADLVNGGNTFAEKTVKLGENIDLNNLNWTPIGGDTNRFKGVFDGDGHSIINMEINKVDATDALKLGLFGAIENAVIKNLTVEDAEITATGTNTMNVGVLTGTANFNSTNYTTEIANTFENVTVDGAEINLTSTGAIRLAGVAGYSYSADLDQVHISNLDLTANAVGNVHGGAIFGYFSPQENGNSKDDTLNPLRNFTIDNVSLEVTQGTNVYFGGLAGFSYYGRLEIDNINISNLTVDTVTNGAFVGSLFGYTNRSTNSTYEINKVTSTDIDFNVTTNYLGETRVGGMVGYLLSQANFTDCSVSGEITESCSTNVVNYHAKVGGFVGRGYTWQQSYTNCTANVDVTGSHVAGGFIGNHITGATYTNCSALGDVTAYVAGGFAGRLTEHTQSRAVTFDGCTASGNVNGELVAGGFIGSTADYGWGSTTGNPYGKTVTIRNCKVTGTVSGNGAVAGIIGEAKMAEGVNIILENVECTITPAILPDDANVEIIDEE